MIIKASGNDTGVLAALALRLWPSHSLSELSEDFARITQSENSVCFIKYSGSAPVGFAHCSLRHDYVEGTHSSPVGYLEGVFVCEDSRGLGFGRELMRECERWAKLKGCTEFASDCEEENASSLAFHLASGFTVANRIICFKKDLF